MGEPTANIYSVVDIKQDLNRWMAAAKNFKKAYELALFFGEIKKPNISYRQALTRYKTNGAVFISDMSHEIGDSMEEGIVVISSINLH